MTSPSSGLYRVGEPLTSPDHCRDVAPAGEKGQLARERLHRDAVLGGQDSDRLHREADGEDFFGIDRGLIPEPLAGHFQEADPPFCAHQVAEEDVPRLDGLSPIPIVLTEPGHLPAGLLEFPPGLPREKVEPIVHCRTPIVVVWLIHYSIQSAQTATDKWPRLSTAAAGSRGSPPSVPPGWFFGWEDFSITEIPR